MSQHIVFERRTESGIVRSGDPGAVFPHWQGADERWLFVSPHDDDIVCGGGLTFVSALASGIATFATVVTTGESGYCRPEHRRTIAGIRREEAKQSFELLGLPKENLFQLHYPDGYTIPYWGHRQAENPNDPNVIEGGLGFQNTFVWLLRKIKPSRVFLPSQTDFHPDHHAVHHEFVISVFHAQGKIWPELGTPIAMIPSLDEYATNCDFQTPPTIRVKSSDELLERKLRGIAAYVSQEQIDLLVEVQRNAGPQEYIRELEFNILNPGKYDALFA